MLPVPAPAVIVRSGFVRYTTRERPPAAFLAYKSAGNFLQRAVVEPAGLVPAAQSGDDMYTQAGIGCPLPQVFVGVADTLPAVEPKVTK